MLFCVCHNTKTCGLMEMKFCSLLPKKFVPVLLMQLYENSFTIHEGEPLNESKIILHTGERMFIIVIDVCFIYSRWQLKVLVNEITHKECTDMYTVSFEQEPYLSVLRKHAIDAY